MDINNAIVMKSGNFTLRIDTDGASSSYGSSSHSSSNSFQSKFRKSCPSDMIPFLVVPSSTSITLGSKKLSSYNMVGYLGAIQDNNKDTFTYCVVGDVGPSSNGWGEVSLKAAWNLGYSQDEANGSRGPYGNFTIYVFEDSLQDWKNINTSNLEYTIQTLGKSIGRVGYSISTINAANYSSEYSQAMINTDLINQYMVTINRNSPTNINYNALKNLGVVGVMVEAGYLYDNANREVERYRNPNIDNQIRAINRAELPYALYADCRAKDTQQARKEMYQLSFVINKYPPALGVWILLNISSTVSINDKIMDVYYNYLYKLGLKDRVGIYATESQLNKITWSKHYDKWCLWLNKHVSNLSEIDTLLTPDFFDVEG